MKKLLSVICICMLLLSSMPLTALAHGSSHSKTKYKLCTVKNCSQDHRRSRWLALAL